MLEAKLGVAVVSFDRPKHLYVTLDSIFRMRYIEQVPVFTFLIENDTLTDRIYMIDDLPTQRMFIKQRGGDAFMYAFYNLFYIQGCHRVVLFGDDQIARTELLDYVNTLQDDDPRVFIDALGGSDSTLGYTYLGTDTSGGISLLKKNFDLVNSWLDTEECIQSLGSNFVPSPALYRYDFDHFLWMFMGPRGYYTRCAPVRYAMCFGVCGVHGPNSPECYDFENERFFAGDKETWLDNIRTILSSNEELPCDVTRMLLPRHFIYG